MLLLTSLSVWMVRNQSLMEMWWLFSSLARYPKEIFAGRWAEPLGNFFTYFVPILVVVNVPANAMVRVLDPGDGRLHGRRDRALALAQPPLLPACAAVVSQREQLKVGYVRSADRRRDRRAVSRFLVAAVTRGARCLGRREGWRKPHPRRSCRRSRSAGVISRRAGPRS